MKAAELEAVQEDCCSNIAITLKIPGIACKVNGRTRSHGGVQDAQP
jgi:hypothetical protein